MGQGRGVRLGVRAEAAIARPVVTRAEHSAARGRHRSHARGSLGHQDADQVLSLAVQAERMVRHPGPAAGQHLSQDAEELFLVDRAARQLQVDRHVVAGRPGVGQGLDVLRRGIHDRQSPVHIQAAEVPQALDPAVRGAGAQRDQEPAPPADVADLLLLLRGSRPTLRPGRRRTRPPAAGGSPPGNRRSRPGRPRSAVRPRNPAARAGSRRTRRT